MHRVFPLTISHWSWPDSEAPRLVAHPAELFVSLGREWHAQQPAGSMMISNAQGWAGYWPDQASFAVGDYEVAAAEILGLQPGDGEWLVDQLNNT